MADGILIGEVAVDSGQVMLIDPCYVFEDHYNLGGEPTGGLYDKACRLTTGATPYGPLEGGMVTGTFHGDGTYPVYAEMEGGRVKSITIVFQDDSLEDEEDEEEDDDSSW
jgi:hypothetical protein